LGFFFIFPVTGISFFFSFFFPPSKKKRKKNPSLKKEKNPPSNKFPKRNLLPLKKVMLPACVELDDVSGLNSWVTLSADLGEKLSVWIHRYPDEEHHNRVSLASFSKASQRLRSLSLQVRPWSEPPIAIDMDALQSLTRLRELTIELRLDPSIGVSLGGVDSSLGGVDSLGLVLSRLRHLRSLSLTRCGTRIGDRELTLLSQSLPMLRSLELRRCTRPMSVEFWAALGCFTQLHCIHIGTERSNPTDGQMIQAFVRGPGAKFVNELAVDHASSGLQILRALSERTVTTGDLILSNLLTLQIGYWTGLQACELVATLPRDLPQLRELSVRLSAIDGSTALSPDRLTTLSDVLCAALPNCDITFL